MAFLIVLAAIAAWWSLRWSIGRRAERMSLARLPLGADGIIEGAAGIHRAGSATRAVLLLHGFGDTPQTLYYLADHLHGLGFSVEVPLLPGHGRTLSEFGDASGDAWLAAAAYELAALRSRFDFVGLVGVSMGGALAVLLAAGSDATKGEASTRHDGRPREGTGGPQALVLLSPYLSMRPRDLRLATMHRVLTPFTRYLASREEASIRDPIERAHNRGFGIVTPRLLDQLQRIMQRAQQALPEVRQPTLVIQSREDNRIEQAAASRSFERLGSEEKRFVWTEGNGHVITVDVGRDHVLALTGDWLLQHAAGIVPDMQTPTSS